LNTPRLIADEQQRTVWRWDHTDRFGGNPPDENPSGLGVFEFPLRFPGQYADRETQLAYNFYRDYSSEIGRYVQSDLIGLAGGINPYLYANANPLSYTDPLGLQVIPAPPPRFPPPAGTTGQGGKPGDIMFPPGMNPNQPRPPTFPEIRVQPFPPSSGPPEKKSICEHLFNQCIKGAQACPPPIMQFGQAFCLSAYIIYITIGGGGGSGGDPTPAGP
jgi:RHS repeat-associated protein